MLLPKKVEQREQTPELRRLEPRHGSGRTVPHLFENRVSIDMILGGIGAIRYNARQFARGAHAAVGKGKDVLQLVTPTCSQSQGLMGPTIFMQVLIDYRHPSPSLLPPSPAILSVQRALYCITLL